MEKNINWGSGIDDMLRQIEINEKGKPFFMRNPNWYYYDYAQHKYFLTNNAPKEAVESYEDFINENPYEPKEKIDIDNPYEYQEDEDDENPYK